MAYHPDPGWLREHGMNPEKARCVEVANARNFLNWTRDQPWMVLHELAHAYHHQFLDGGFENAEVARGVPPGDATRRRYESVLHIDGKEVKALRRDQPDGVLRRGDARRSSAPTTSTRSSAPSCGGTTRAMTTCSTALWGGALNAPCLSHRAGSRRRPPSRRRSRPAGRPGPSWRRPSPCRPWGRP